MKLYYSEQQNLYYSHWNHGATIFLSVGLKRVPFLCDIWYWLTKHMNIEVFISNEMEGFTMQDQPKWPDCWPKEIGFLKKRLGPLKNHSRVKVFGPMERMFPTLYKDAFANKACFYISVDTLLFCLRSHPGVMQRFDGADPEIDSVVDAFIDCRYKPPPHEARMRHVGVNEELMLQAVKTPAFGELTAPTLEAIQFACQHQREHVQPHMRRGQRDYKVIANFCQGGNHRSVVHAHAQAYVASLTGLETKALHLGSSDGAWAQMCGPCEQCKHEWIMDPNGEMFGLLIDSLSPADVHSALLH